MLKIFALKKNKKAIADLDKLKKTLSTDEKKRVKKFSRAEDIESFILGRYLLRSVLAKILKINPSEVNIKLSEYGKPYLSDKKTEYKFNLSHAGDWIVLALCRGGEVGIDIEKIKPIDLSIAEKFFLQPEIDYIFKKCEEKIKRFYKIWTLRESYLKCLGLGLNYPLADFYFKMGKNIKVIDKNIKKENKFLFFNLNANYLSTVCFTGDFSSPKINYVKINSHD